LKQVSALVVGWSSSIARATGIDEALGKKTL